MRIMLTGSRCFSFIKNPHDFDVLIDTNEIINKSFRQNHDKEIREYLVSLDIGFNKETDTYDMFKFKGIEKDICIQRIIYHDKNLSPYSFIDEKDLILKNKEKLLEEFIQIKIHLNRLLEKNTFSDWRAKIYYPIFICLYYIKNNFNSNFTQEQLKIINEFHDKGSLDIESIQTVLSEISTLY